MKKIIVNKKTMNKINKVADSVDNAMIVIKKIGMFCLFFLLCIFIAGVESIMSLIPTWALAIVLTISLPLFVYFMVEVFKQLADQY